MTPQYLVFVVWARVVRRSFWVGEDRMVEELRRTAAPRFRVLHEVWTRYGDTPAFVENLSGGT